MPEGLKNPDGGGLLAYKINCSVATMKNSTALDIDPSVIDATRARLQPLRRARRLPAVAKACGLSYEWVRLFSDGRVPNPGYLSLHALVRAIDQVESEQ